MGKLLKLEYRRLFQAKSLYICTLISLVLVLISALTTKLLLKALSDAAADEVMALASLQTPTSLSMLKQVGSSSMTMILAVFVSIFVTEDYAGDTIKNVYSRGYSRDMIFFSKCIAALSAALMMILVNAAFSFAMGKVLFGEIGTMGKNYAVSMIAALCLLVAYETIYFMVAISIRKVGGSIAISIFGPMIVGLLFSLVNAIPTLKEYNFYDYWLEGRMTAMMSAEVESKELLSAFLVAAVVIALFGVLGFFINRKREN